MGRLNQCFPKHIKALEIELGVDLFTRTTRRVELTSYGQTFLPYAKSITCTEFEGTSAIKRLQNIENGLLTIATIPCMPQYQIPMFLAQFQQLYPETTVRITEDDPNNLFEYLRNETCELIFTREDKLSFENNFMTNNQIMHIPYMRDKMVALLSKNHPLANETSVTLQQIKEERFCLIKEGSLIHDMCMAACQNAGFIPNIIFTSHRIDSIIDMVTNQNCIALLMDKHVHFTNNGSKQTNVPWTTVLIVPEINSQISVCYRTDRVLSDIANKFIDFCTTRLFG